MACDQINDHRPCRRVQILEDRLANTESVLIEIIKSNPELVTEFIKQKMEIDG